MAAPTPEEVLADFFAAAGRAEDMLMDPLILHTERVSPLVIQEVGWPDMPHRRYAILFLGQARVRGALPVLRRILADSQERNDFRADALEAIHSIDPTEGRLLASESREFSGSAEHLMDVAIEIDSGVRVRSERTYWQAFWGEHK